MSGRGQLAAPLRSWPAEFSMRLVGLIVVTALAACDSGGSMPPSSAATDGIRLVLGDDVYVTGDQAGGALSSLHKVSPPATPADVIHLQLAKDTFATGPAFILTVDNFFTSPFVFHALIEYSSAPNQLKPSCTYPVSPSISDVALWSDPITALTFQDVEFTATNDEVCAYH
jgi:hypothetical protein